MNPPLSDHRPEVPAKGRQPPLWLLALFTFSGTLAMHVFVPALPRAGEELGASIPAMQMTVSLYIAGLAVGQLVYGPLADRFGRRPMLMAGLALFALSGLAAALAGSVGALIVARLFQALGGCAGLVLARAMVRDTAGPIESARRQALMNLMVTVGPGLAPIIGSAVTTTLGWRAIFYALAAFGIVNFLLAWRLLPETGSRIAHDIGTLARNYRRLVVSPAFLGYSVGGGCATTSMYAFVAVAPFVFINEMHRPSHEVGLFLALLVSGVWLGSVLASRLIGRLPIGRLLVSANLASLVAAFLFLASALTGELTVAGTIGTMFVYTVGVGIAAPAALTQAVSVNPAVIGSASGLYGFTQMTVGALCTAAAGIGSDPALAAAVVLALSGCVAQFAFFVAGKRQ